MVPSQAILGTEFGQRFLLNLCHCWEKGLFEDNNRVEEILRIWWKRCIDHKKTDSPTEAFGVLIASVEREYVLWGKSVDLNGNLLSRVVTFPAFYSASASPDPENYSFLDVKYVTDVYGIGMKMSISDEVFEAIDEIQKDPDAIRPDVVVRGRMPLSWATFRHVFDQERSRISEDYSDELAFQICRRLGLVGGHYLGLALFQLNYPDADADIADASRRPTAIEGLGHSFFRARRDGNYADAAGRAIDFGRFENKENDVDGAEEVVVPSIPLSREFSWKGIGFLREDTTPSDESEFCARLSTTAVPERLEQAARLIDRICQ
jgi:hypothetical protein